MGKIIKDYPYNSNDPRTCRSPSWDGSQERMLIETVLNQRFNFFLVFVGLVVAGAIRARDDKWLLLWVLGFGFVICLLLSWTILRAHQKLDVIMDTLYSDKSHPAAMVNDVVKGYSVRGIIGWVIPGLCTLALFGWGAWVASQLLHCSSVPGSAQTTAVVNPASASSSQPGSTPNPNASPLPQDVKAKPAQSPDGK